MFQTRYARPGINLAAELTSCPQTARKMSSALFFYEVYHPTQFFFLAEEKNNKNA
jgi:hypothetical protein